MHEWTVSLETSPLGLTTSRLEKASGKLLDELVARDTHAGAVSANLEKTTLATTISVLDAPSVEVAAGLAFALFRASLEAAGIKGQIAAVEVELVDDRDPVLA